jgi:hypothetical protein
MMNAEHSYYSLLAAASQKLARQTHITVIEFPETLPAQVRGVSQSLLDYSVQERQK